MNNGKSSSLEQLLLFDNFQILGTPFKFAEVIHKREGGKWNEAQRKASELIKANAAWNYLEDLRERMSTEEQSQTTIVIQPIETEVPIIPAEQTAQINQEDEKQKQNEDMFEENYPLLTKFAPELEEELQALTEKSILSGKSATNQYGSTSIKSVEKDKYGYYLLLEINESAQPQQQILLFVSTTKRSVQVLYSESGNGKFDVYNDIHTREMVNPLQLEIQNNHLTEQLKRLVDHKLSIPTIGVAQIEEPKAEELKSQEEKTLDQVFHKMVKYDDDFIRRSNERYLDELIEENEALTEENEALKEENEELRKDNEFTENSVFPTLYSQSFKLLRVLIPDLSDEFERGLDKFTVYLESQKPNYPRFRIEFKLTTRCIFCDIFEIDLNPNEEEDIQCEFIIRNKTHAYFAFSSESFLTFKKDIHAGDYEEVSQIGLEANSALHNFFLTLLFHKYQSTIGDRIYLAETIENTPTEVQGIESVEESDGTGAVVAVLATIGLGILGFKFLK